MSRYYNDISYSPVVLQHSGTKGMHWHERRYQNEDGTLTEEGKKRYSKAKSSFDKADAKAVKYRSKAEATEKKNAPKLSKLKLKAQKETNYANYHAGLQGLDPFAAQQKYKYLSDRTKRSYDKHMSKVGNINSKIARIETKSNKLNYKADKYLNKGQKIANKLAREFEKDGSTLDTPLTASRAALGKKKVDSLMQSKVNEMLYDELHKRTT